MKKYIALFLMMLSSVSSGYSANVDTIVVRSKLMNIDIRNLVIKPDKYYCNSTCHFPVLYLLHGAGGSFADWVNKVPEIITYADRYSMIIVCPDGGKTSWYMDSPVDSSCRYESYLYKELVPYVDSHFRTVKNKKGRAITGNSMGGYGAFSLAIKHQDIWGAAGSMSGLFDLTQFPDRWDLAIRLGKLTADSSVWHNYSVEKMVSLLSNSKLQLIFECGISDYFYPSNLKFHEALIRLNYPHDFTAHEGSHSWKYWPNTIKYQMLFFYYFFDQGNVYTNQCSKCK